MLHIVCALKHEARPLIDHFQLAHDGAAQEFTTYANPDSGITLTITGTGLQAAGKGTDFVIGYHNTGYGDCWLNIGIAGHASLPVGTPVLASRVTSEENGRSWIPVIEFPHTLDLSPLQSSSAASTAYRPDTMYDMEAAGFFQAASAIGNPDRVHCLKIISDNRDNPAENISADSVRQLITQNLVGIESIVNKLLTLME